MRWFAGIVFVTLLASRGAGAVEFEFVPLGNLRGSDDFGKRSEQGNPKALPYPKEFLRRIVEEQGDSSQARPVDPSLDQ